MNVETYDYKKHRELNSSPENDCYYEIKTKCSVVKDLREYALNHNDWYTNTKNDKYSFLQCSVPDSIVQKDRIMKKLSESMKNSFSMYLMPAWTYYAMHTDTYRTCAINLALDRYNSTTFFNLGRFRRNQLYIHELKYKPDTYYVFNTQIKHAILNKDYDRYVLSMGFNNISYHELVDKMKILENDV